MMSNGNGKNGEADQDAPQAPEATDEQAPIEEEAIVEAPHSPEERIAELEAQLKQAERQVALIRQAHAEAAADFDKTKERLRRNNQAEIERARMSMTRSLFDVADNLERTIEGVRGGGSVETLLEGVGHVRDQFMRALGEFGLERFDPSGKPFDPELHEAIGVMPVSRPEQDNTVVAVFKPGFRAGQHVLRPALVQVGKYQEPAPTPGDTPDN